MYKIITALVGLLLVAGCGVRQTSEEVLISEGVKDVKDDVTSTVETATSTIDESWSTKPAADGFREFHDTVYNVTFTYPDNWTLHFGGSSTSTLSLGFSYDSLKVSLQTPPPDSHVSLETFVIHEEEVRIKNGLKEKITVLGSCNGEITFTETSHICDLEVPGYEVVAGMNNFSFSFYSENEFESERGKNEFRQIVHLIETVMR